MVLTFISLTNSVKRQLATVAVIGTATLLDTLDIANAPLLYIPQSGFISFIATAAAGKDRAVAIINKIPLFCTLVIIEREYAEILRSSFNNVSSKSVTIIFTIYITLTILF